MCKMMCKNKNIGTTERLVRAVVGLLLLLLGVLYNSYWGLIGLIPRRLMVRAHNCLIVVEADAADSGYLLCSTCLAISCKRPEHLQSSTPNLMVIYPHEIRHLPCMSMRHILGAVPMLIVGIFSARWWPRIFQ